MKIGEYEIIGTDKECADKIITDFLEIRAEILKGEAPGGRNGNDDKNFCIFTNILQNVGIKRQFRDHTDLDVELVLRDIRNTLNFSGFKIEKIKGFPMDGDNWRNGCLLISDWGPEGKRIDLNRLTRDQINENRNEFLNEFAVNSAISCFLGLWDREPRNFVWDTAEKRIFSIDHEKFHTKPWDVEICEQLSRCVKKFFGNDWYDDPILNKTFSTQFIDTWELLVTNLVNIGDIYRRYQFSRKSMLLNLRRDKGADFFLANIML